ncbi:hypothetical protein C723_1642 [Christiangramia flava JLT2011]|uniref:Uncharacterized protein n=1 Tax=Christiangramia flava JLT2011 TaxID=1229726 RepID=A0A1L7IAJ6_9FLAO|nr:hypothetical protein GRFL_3530 [Christiangramia flava JLT2011]OSS39740.1 hypothetical protein C723_1642 [Christiangramia flava JLT2011]
MVKGYFDLKFIRIDNFKLNFFKFSQLEFVPIPVTLAGV